MKSNFFLSTFACLFFSIFSSCSTPQYEIIDIVDEPVAAPLTPPVIAKKDLIIIDPGHGGKDLGANSPKNPKYQEKNLTLSTSKLLKYYLEQLGYAVQMTRNSDIFIELQDRASFANKRQPMLFVSVHYNAAPNKNAEGIEVFYYRSDSNKERSSASKELAQLTLDHLIQETEANSRGVKHGNFAVIRKTKMPAILVESGFLTNAAELKKIKTAAYQKKIAWGIAQGIDAYVKENLSEN